MKKDPLRSNVADRQSAALPIWGMILGLAFGHLDLGYRVMAPPAFRNFEWQEVYQALLFPMLLFGLLFGAGALAGVVLSRLGAISTVLSSTGRVLLGFFTVLIFGQAVLVQGWLGQTSFFDQTGGVVGALWAFVALLVAVIIVPRLPRMNPPAPLRSYTFFAFAFALSLLGYDLVQMRTAIRFPKAERTPPAASPNIILVSLDTVRADLLTPYNPAERTTPKLAAFAHQARVFTNAFSVSSWTLPAHASLFTGRYPHEHGAHARHQSLTGEEFTLAEMLAEQGYVTAGFVAGPFCMARYGLAQGFHHYDDRLDFVSTAHTKDRLSLQKIARYYSPTYATPIFGSDGERTAEELNEAALRWFTRYRETAPERPFFLFLNYFDAHDPYFLSLSRSTRSRELERQIFSMNQRLQALYTDRNARYLTKAPEPGEREFALGRYREELEYLDFHLFRLLDQILLEAGPNTLVILVADHGEEFFEHGGVLHAQTLHQEVLHVPMIVSWPALISPGQTATPVSLIDIVPTIRDLLRISPESTPLVSGRSLVGALQGEAAEGVERPLIASRYARPSHGEVELHAVLENGFKLIEAMPERGRISSGLYHLPTDPQETDNLIEQDSERAESLRRKLPVTGDADRTLE